MKHIIVFLSIIFLFFSCKKKEYSSISPSTANYLNCTKPKSLNFGKLVFTDNQGNVFYTNQSDLDEQWQTEKQIPCYFNSMFDNTHFIPNDTSVADSVFQISTYPNPSQSGNLYVNVLSRQQVVIHLLVVDSKGNFVFKKNHYSGQVNSSVQTRNEGIVDPDGPRVYLNAYIDLSSVLPPMPNAYYRVYYYFSTKNNARFGEGYWDIYIGKYPNFVYGNY